MDGKFLSIKDSLSSNLFTIVDESEGHCLKAKVNVNSKVINARSTTCHSRNISIICRHWKYLDLNDVCSGSSNGNSNSGSQNTVTNNNEKGFLEMSLNPDNWGTTNRGVALKKAYRKHLRSKVGLNGF